MTNLFGPLQTDSMFHDDVMNPPSILKVSTTTDKTTDITLAAATTKKTTTDVYNTQDSLNSTGSTIPQNGPKGDYNDDSEDANDLMIDDDLDDR